MSDKKTGEFIFVVTFFIFLTLKLAEIGMVAKWSWWVVTAPLWFPIAVSLGWIALCGGFWLLVGIFGIFFGKKRQPASGRRR